VTGTSRIGVVFPIAPLSLSSSIWLFVVHSRLIRRDVYSQQEKVPEFFYSFLLQSGVL
jgi:hypothetical protein